MNKNWADLNLQALDADYDFAFFFDGDSDRIIIKIKGNPEPFDGN